MQGANVTSETRFELMFFVVSMQHRMQLTNFVTNSRGYTYLLLVKLRDNTTYVQQAFVVVLYCIVIIFNDTIQYNNATPILQQYNNYIATNTFSVV